MSCRVVTGGQAEDCWAVVMCVRVPLDKALRPSWLDQTTWEQPHAFKRWRRDHGTRRPAPHSATVGALRSTGGAVSAPVYSAGLGKVDSCTLQ